MRGARVSGTTSLAPGDGYRFHGRGYFQYTGRDNYTAFGAKFGVDLAHDPEKAADPETAAKLAIAYWKDKVPARYREDAHHAGAIINGGLNGSAERVRQSELWKTTITPELVGAVKAGTISLSELASHGLTEHGRLRGATAQKPRRGETLRLGDHGADVAELQAKLDRLGYRGPNGESLINRDHHFGPMTHEAVCVFQRSHHLLDDGIVGSATHRAIDRQWQEKQAQISPTLDDSTHPGYEMYRQAAEAVYRLDSQHGRAPDQRSDNLAAALAVAARAVGMSRIDHVLLGNDASQAYAIQGDMGSPLKRYVDVDVVQAITTPITQSSAAWKFDDTQALSVQSQPLQPRRSGPAMMS